MAARFCDSFDHYDDADFTAKYDSTGGTPAIGSGGRFQRAFTLGDVDRVSKVLDSQATWIVGLALQMPNATVVLGSVQIVGLLDGTTLHVDLRWTSGNQIVLTRNGTQLGSASAALSRDTWYFVELKVTISDTGSYEVRIDGVNVNSSGSADTRNGANASANTIRVGNTTAGVLGSGMLIDDLYVCDGTTGAGSNPCNDFLGDVRVENILPTGNGNSSQLDGSDGNTTDNYLLVDDADTAVDGDTTYVESADVGDKDTYAYGNITPSSGDVFFVQPIPYARKTDAGGRSICSIARLSSTEVDSADKPLSVSYRYYPDVRETKPGGGDWTVSDVNSAEFGVKVTA